MKRLLSLASLIMILLLAGPVAAESCRVLHFRAIRAPDGEAACVVANGKILMRLRGEDLDGLLSRASIVADKLNAVAAAGVSAGNVATRGSRTETRIVIREQNVISIDGVLARNCNSSHLGLAQAWAGNIKNAFAQRYITFAPHDELTVPVGETRAIRWGGAIAVVDSAKTADDKVARVEIQDAEKKLEVRALTTGTTTLTVSALDCQHTIKVDCRKWAAHVPFASELRISGSQTRTQALTRAAESLIRSAVQVEPNASLTIGEPLSVTAGYRVDVSASGETYLPVNRLHTVAISRIEAPKHQAGVVLVSNFPEKLTQPAVLLRESVVDGRTVRLLWHHINVSSAPLWMTVRIHNVGDVATPVHITEAGAGPSNDEIFAGHSAARRFLEDLFCGTGYVLTVPAGSTVELSAVKLRPRELASGVARFAPLQSTALIVEVACHALTEPRSFISPVPEALRGSPQLSGLQFEGRRDVELRHSVGGNWGFYRLGDGRDVNSHGQLLAGSYGVLHRVNASVENPTDRPAIVELAVGPRGGVARGSFWIAGKLVETPVLNNSSEVVIHKGTVAPGGKYQIEVATIPESGSHYPVMLTLRSWQK